MTDPELSLATGSCREPASKTSALNQAGAVAMSVPRAAAALGISASQLRRDIARGAPVVSRGSVGRSRGSLIDLAAYRRWRNREFDAGRAMEAVEQALIDVLKRDAGLGEPAHVSIGIRRQQAAAVLCIAYERIHRAITGHDAESLPSEIAHAVRDLSGWRP